jgi:hypothetical protein
VKVFRGAAVFDVIELLEPTEEWERDFKAFLILLRLRVFFSLSSDGLSVPLSSMALSVLSVQLLCKWERRGW